MTVLWGGLFVLRMQDLDEGRKGPDPLIIGVDFVTRGGPELE